MKNKMENILNQLGLESAKPAPDLEEALTNSGCVWNQVNPEDPSMCRWRVTLIDAKELSIIRGVYSYGGDEGLFETALIQNGHCDEDSILGYQSVTDILNIIQTQNNLC